MREEIIVSVTLAALAAMLIAGTVAVGVHRTERCAAAGVEACAEGATGR